MEGRVRFFDTARGFGFICITNESGEIVGDWFFHERDVIGEHVKKGDLVNFWLSDSSNRRTANLECVEVVRVS